MYGKCVSANYQNVKKDMCLQEFMAFKDCYMVRLPSPLFDPNAKIFAEGCWQEIIAASYAVRSACHCHWPMSERLLGDTLSIPMP